eukprot:6969216-Pyramimonas_sp.AAC.1
MQRCTGAQERAKTQEVRRTSAQAGSGAEARTGPRERADAHRCTDLPGRASAHAQSAQKDHNCAAARGTR